MTASAAFTVNGAQNPATHIVTYGATVNLALTSIVGAKQISWTVFGKSAADFSDPTITPGGSPSGQTATFPFPADPGTGVGRSVLVLAAVTGVDGQLHTQAAIVGVANAQGIVPASVNETFERDGTHGIVAIINAFLALPGIPGPAGADGGLHYGFDSSTTTSSDPGTGDFRLNHATPASATAACFSDVDDDGGNNEAYLLAQDDSTTVAHRGYVTIRKASDQTVWARYDITGACTDSSGFVQFALTYAGGNGSFTNGDACIVSFSRTGDTGAAGSNGSNGTNGTNGTDPGVRYTFSTSTSTGTDPGNGGARFNNATIGSVTVVALDDLTFDGTNVETFLLAQDDSTNTAHRGLIVVRQVNDPTKFAVFNITGASTDSAGWVQFTVSGGIGVLPDNSATISVQFYRTGNLGATGTNGTNAGLGYTFSTNTTVSSDPGNGVLRLNNATLASVTAAAIDDLTTDGGNVETFLLAQDDSTTTAHRGLLLIRQANDPTKWALFDITGASTNSAGWVQFALTHFASGTLPDDAALLSVQFFRTGDTGAAGTDAPAPLAGSNLTDASTTVSPCGTGAAGYQFTLPSSTLTTNRTLTLGVAATGLAAGQVVTLIINAQPSTHTYAIANGGTNGGTLVTVPAATKARVTARYDGVDWKSHTFEILA